MSGEVVLIAEDNKKFRETIARLLQLRGYRARQAATIEEARKQLSSGVVQLALIDVRFENEQDGEDGGLRLATDPLFRHIPKIILTGLDLTDVQMRMILDSNAHGSASIQHLRKDEGNRAIEELVKQGLETSGFPPTMPTIFGNQRLQVRKAVLKQATLNFYITLAASLIGFVAIMFGILMTWFQGFATGIVSASSGLLLQAISYLFFNRLDRSNERLDAYHRELLEPYWFELIIVESRRLPEERKQDCIERALGAATDRFIAPVDAAKRSVGKRSKRRRNDDEKNDLVR